MVIDSGKITEGSFREKRRRGERNVSWVHWNGNTLAICRNTGKSFHRFPSSIRSEWHRNPVGLTPFSPDRTCLSLSLSLSDLTARKNTRGRRDDNLSAENSHRNGISLSRSRSFRVIQSEASIYPFLDLSCVQSSRVGGRSPFEKFSRKRRNLLEFFVNWIVSRSTSRVT